MHPAVYASAAGAAARALRAIVTADDERAPASKAFGCALQLAGKEVGALKELLAVLRWLSRFTGDRPVDALVAVMAAVRQVGRSPFCSGTHTSYPIYRGYDIYPIYDFLACLLQLRPQTCAHGHASCSIRPIYLV